MESWFLADAFIRALRASLDATYNRGGETKIDGDWQDNKQENGLLGASVGFMLSPQFGGLIAYSDTVSEALVVIAGSVMCTSMTECGRCVRWMLTTYPPDIVEKNGDDQYGDCSGGVPRSPMGYWRLLCYGSPLRNSAKTVQDWRCG